MSRRSRIPASRLFEAAAHGAQFRDRVAIVVKASPEAIFRALRDVTLPDMKLAWLLGEIRYLPSRLSGDEPPPSLTSPHGGATRRIVKCITIARHGWARGFDSSAQ